MTWSTLKLLVPFCCHIWPPRPRCHPSRGAYPPLRASFSASQGTTATARIGFPSPTFNWSSARGLHALLERVPRMRVLDVQAERGVQSCRQSLINVLVCAHFSHPFAVTARCNSQVKKSACLQMFKRSQALTTSWCGREDLALDRITLCKYTTLADRYRALL